MRGSQSEIMLLATDRPDEVAVIRKALREARIPFRSGLLAGEPPRVIFSVPRQLSRAAQEAVGTRVAPDSWLVDDEEDETNERPPPFPVMERFPTRPIKVLGALIVLHLVLVMCVTGPIPPASTEFLRWGGLVAGGTWQQPWRLLSSLFLHVDPRHVLSNALSMLVFAVPLITYLGYARTAVIYAVAGVGGGLTALSFAEPGTIIVGSSGAVAGLFGAWIVITLIQARHAPLTWRARMRTLGVALLVLPTFLSPTTPSGQPVSVSSHLGGLATGMVIGAVISGAMMLRKRGTDPGAS